MSDFVQFNKREEKTDAQTIGEVFESITFITFNLNFKKIKYYLARFSYNKRKDALIFLLSKTTLEYTLKILR